MKYIHAVVCNTDLNNLIRIQIILFVISFTTLWKLLYFLW